MIVSNSLRYSLSIMIHGCDAYPEMYNGRKSIRVCLTELAFDCS